MTPDVREMNSIRNNIGSRDFSLMAKSRTGGNEIGIAPMAAATQNQETAKMKNRRMKNAWAATEIGSENDSAAKHQAQSPNSTGATCNTPYYGNLNQVT
jgi:hypothetical protein